MSCGNSEPTESGYNGVAISVAHDMNDNSLVMPYMHDVNGVFYFMGVAACWAGRV